MKLKIQGTLFFKTFIKNLLFPIARAVKCRFFKTMKFKNVEKKVPRWLSPSVFTPVINKFVFLNSKYLKNDFDCLLWPSQSSWHFSPMIHFKVPKRRLKSATTFHQPCKDQFLPQKNRTKQNPPINLINIHYRALFLSPSFFLPCARLLTESLLAQKIISNKVSTPIFYH